MVSFHVFGLQKCHFGGGRRKKTKKKHAHKKKSRQVHRGSRQRTGCPNKIFYTSTMIKDKNPIDYLKCNAITWLNKLLVNVWRYDIHHKRLLSFCEWFSKEAWYFHFVTRKQKQYHIHCKYIWQWTILWQNTTVMCFMWKLQNNLEIMFFVKYRFIYVMAM